LAVLGDDLGPGEALGDVGGGGVDEAASEVGVGCDAGDGLGEAIGGVFGDEEGCVAIAEDVADAGDVGGDDGDAGGHSFNEDEAEAFGGGGENEEGGVRESILGAGDGAVEGDERGEGKRGDERLDGGSLGAGAEDVEMDQALEDADGVEEVGDALDGVEAADEGDGEGAGLRRRGGDRREIGEVDGVGDDFDAM